jgi:hypothetical protein
MKSLLLSIFSFLVIFCSCGQPKFKRYSFNDIGMSVIVPAEFNIKDSFSLPQFRDSNDKLITDTQTIGELSSGMMKLLLVINTVDNKNSMSINIIPVNEKSIQTIGDSAQYLEFSKTMLEASTRQLSQKFDTNFTTVKIGSLLIDKLFTVTKVDSIIYHSGIYYSKIKDYYLVIKIDYEDENNGKKLESVIEGAEFE